MERTGQLSIRRRLFRQLRLMVGLPKRMCGRSRLRCCRFCDERRFPGISGALYGGRNLEVSDNGASLAGSEALDASDCYDGECERIDSGLVSQPLLELAMAMTMHQTLAACKVRCVSSFRMRTRGWDSNLELQTSIFRQQLRPERCGGVDDSADE